MKRIKIQCATKGCSTKFTRRSNHHRYCKKCSVERDKDQLKNRIKFSVKNLPPNLVNRRFGRLKVTAFSHTHKYPSGSVHSLWECLCDCGRSIITSKVGLQTGNTRSCGCSRLKKAPYKDVYKRYKQQAKRRGIGFYLSQREFKNITSSDCAYCGKAPFHKIREQKLGPTYLYNGVDRVKNNIGYRAPNCLPCCWNCNVAKGSKTVEEFYFWVTQVYERMTG